MCGVRIGPRRRAAAVQAAVGGPALPATVAAMSRAARPKAGGLWPRERRAMVSAAGIAMRRCNGHVLGGWLRSQLASAAHVAERAVGQRARIAKGASGVLVLDASRRGAACASARGQTGRRCARALVGRWRSHPPACLPRLESKLLAAYRRVEGVDSDGSGCACRANGRTKCEALSHRWCAFLSASIGLRSAGARALCARSARALPALFPRSCTCALLALCALGAALHAHTALAALC